MIVVGEPEPTAARPGPRARGAEAFLLAAGLAALAAGLPGCARRADPRTAPEHARAGRGAVSFSVLPDIVKGPPQLPPTEEIVSPYVLGQLTAPSYPPDLLAAGVGPASVALRIVVGPEGAVKEIGDSPLAPAGAGPHQAAFRAAAVEAVRLWAFQPARWRRLEPGADFDGDGRPDSMKVVASEPIAVYLDFRFDFEIVDGEPRVGTSARDPR